MKKTSIGILTGGGDCPGLNAVIRAVSKKAIIGHGWEIIGVEDGYEGLLKGAWRKLSSSDVSGILTIGGTILGTSNKDNPYKVLVQKGKKTVFEDHSKKALRSIKKMGISCLVCIGGDGTLNIASKLYRDGVPVVGVPKTIDNDLLGTDITFGFYSAVSICTEAIDRVHTTAQSHHRVMIVEVMGRTAGWIALYAGVAGGGDIILMPEIPYDINAVAEKVRERNRRGKKFSIVIVAEGAKPKGGDVVVQRIVKESTDPIRLGGVGFVIGKELEEITGIETRTVVIGHVQRGGSPTAIDRILATQLGTKACELIEKKDFGKMVGIRGGELISVPLADVAKGARTVPLDNELIRSARAIGVSFGD